MNFLKSRFDRSRRAAVPAVLATLVLLCQPAPSLAQQPDFSNWMGNAQQSIQAVPLKGISMPGTHDSFTYVTYQNPPAGISSQSTLGNFDETQDLDITGQLNAGVRYFDMRTILLDGNGVGPGGGTSPCGTTDGAYPVSGAGYYMYVHNYLCTGVKLTDTLDQMSAFLDKHPHEIILLHFSGTVQAGPPNYNTSAAFESVVDQHLRRGSDRASYIYDRQTACQFAGLPWTPYPTFYLPTAAYAGACEAPNNIGVLPQEVTPQQLYATSARVIIMEEFGLTGTGFGGPDFPSLTWPNSNTENLRGYWEQPAPCSDNPFENSTPCWTGSSDISTLDNWLEYSTPNGKLGLYALRPVGAGYEGDSSILTLQAELTPGGGGPLIFVGPMFQAQQFNPQLASIINTTWNPYSVNVVQTDRVDFCLSTDSSGNCNQTVVNAITNLNSGAFGRVPFGSPGTGASQISVGHDGSVYKLGFSDGVGSGALGQNHVLYKLIGHTGYMFDWAQTSLVGNRIAVDPSGAVWILDNTGNLSKLGANGVFTPNVSPVLLQDIAVDGITKNLWSIYQGAPLTGSQSGNGSISWAPTFGINDAVKIAANNSIVAVLDSHGNLFQYQGNGSWTALKQPFTATSVAVDDSGHIWATQSKLALGRFPGYVPVPTSGVWNEQNGIWTQWRSSGVQVATGFSSSGLDTAYVVDENGNAHNVYFAVNASGTGLQAPPPKRYAATVSVSGLTFNHATQLFTGTLTVTNNTDSPITDQLAVVFQGLSQGVTIANNPLTYQQLPFILMPSVTLQPGDSTSTQVQFSDPNLVHINYLTEVFAYVAGS